MRIFLCGDVMVGRGIDQALPHPCDPAIHESYLHSAIDYLRLAERANGPLTLPLDPSYIWGAALEELDRVRPDARIVNLETSITRSEDFLPKGINYRGSPENARCLAAAGIDCCTLANNHVLDWGRAGLVDTLATLDALGIRHAGAGRDDAAAARPAVVSFGADNRRLVFSAACAGERATSSSCRSTGDRTGATPSARITAALPMP
jgi:poly-gamma-glutamate synthesis protein (capsule biosynthesis protein)